MFTLIILEIIRIVKEKLYEDESELEYEPIPIKKRKKQIRSKKRSPRAKFNFLEDE